MNGYCAWPARVIAIDKNQKFDIHVQFFGDNTTHKTTIIHIFGFSNSAEVILSNLKGRKNPLYAKAIKEAELCLGISCERSLTCIYK